MYNFDMGIADIILWTISITLSVFSITFGAIAAYSSSKANKSIKETISAEWVITATTKYFFDHIKAIKIENQNLIKRLEKPISFREYSTLASHTRFPIISPTSKDIIRSTEYVELLELYIWIKKDLETKFIDIVDFKMLGSADKIPDDIREKLNNYHNDIENQARRILKMYAKINVQKEK